MMGDLNTFPVSYKVQGKRIVIVGGGDEALNKARLALKTTASVVIVALFISSKELANICEDIIETYDTAVLERAAIVFIAEHSELADRVKADARARDR